MSRHLLHGRNAGYQIAARSRKYGQAGLVRIGIGDGGDAWAFRDQDAAFTADFSVVPEPATVILTATGLIAIGGVGLVRHLRLS